MPNINIYGSTFNKKNDQEKRLRAENRIFSTPYVLKCNEYHRFVAYAKINPRAHGKGSETSACWFGLYEQGGGDYAHFT